VFSADLENELFALEGHAERSCGEILSKSFVAEVETARIALCWKLQVKKNPCSVHLGWT
jgi:hypothetical protein